MTVRAGDLARLDLATLQWHGVIVRWNGDPDEHCIVMDETGATAHDYACNLTFVGRRVGELQVIADPALSGLRERILHYAASPGGRRAIRAAMAPTTLIARPNGEIIRLWNDYTKGGDRPHLERLKGGAPEPWQLPWRMADEFGVPVEALLNYVQFWGAKGNGLLSELYAYNSDWYHALDWMRDGGTAKELAEAWDVAPGTIRNWAAFGRSWLRTQLRERFADAHRDEAAA